MFGQVDWELNRKGWADLLIASMLSLFGNEKLSKNRQTLHADIRKTTALSSLFLFIDNYDVTLH
ncbi:hypothetical protein AV654_32610 [Paenibacillus elgii]|uniref:Uncharacterized protein n=1 Tax=Paenibacillus elgii TaxID=189691 RepID=A0A163UJP2_9BACL|nr:hypothetical protein AV654_32610 [Paenibacillus elgii]